MTLEEIKHGESKNIEFKIQLPDDSRKYMKTVVAFANTSGGKIVLGVDDITKDIVGVDRNSVFQIMDKIANAVSDMCMPQIVPDKPYSPKQGNPGQRRNAACQIPGKPDSGLHVVIISICLIPFFPQVIPIAV